MLIVYKTSKETAQQILDFFQKNPNRQDCKVNTGNYTFTYTRDDIENLQTIVNCAQTEVNEQHAN